MFYRSFKGKNISALGLGCMRLPLCAGDNAVVDEPAAAEMIAYAMEHGINYYDTAWGYHEGNSETVMGKLLKEYPREQYYLADKFPGYDLSNMDKVEEIFEKQLEKCGTEYFDFYLFHNVCEMNIDGYLDPQYGIFEYLKKQKENGRIRHLGFSTHGNLQTMRRFLDAYGKDMEFCQIQLNWLDWEFQNARAKIALLEECGIPVWVMEPVRGGKLAKLSDAHAESLRKLAPERTPAEWAFRFLHGLDLTVTLSGMSDMAQLKENIAVYESEKPLDGAEREALLSIAREMTSRGTVPCTACRYCTAHCPQELDIPWMMELYNELMYTGNGFMVKMGLASLAEEKKPSACLGCRGCEAVCPQNIRISEVMADFTEKTK